MALKDLIKATKADRYTADGRDQLNEALQADVEDRTYKTGEISEKTGLQKQPDGSWAPPKKGGAPAGRNLGTKRVPRGPGAIVTPGKGSIGMEEMKEAAEKGLKGQALKEFMMGKKNESKPAGVTVRQGYETKQLDETMAEHLTKNLDAYKGYQPYDMEELVLKPSGYKRQTSARIPSGGKSVTYTKPGESGEVTLFFDKEGELENVDTSAAESKPGRDYPVLKNKDHIELAEEVKSNTMPGSDWTAEEIAKEWRLGKADAEEVKKEFDKIKESKPAASNNIQWNEQPNGRVWTGRSEGGKPLVVTWNREKNGDVWYGRSDSDVKYKTKEEAMNAPVEEPEWLKKINKEYASVIQKNPKLQRYLNQGKVTSLEVPGEGTYLGENAVARHRELTKENNENVRQGGKAKEYKLKSVDIDEQTARDLIENYMGDAAPRELTGDCKIRVRRK